jgi:hypothetical protein
MKRAPITYETTPVTNAAPPPAKPRAPRKASAAATAPAEAKEAGATEMLSARVSVPIARQFRALVKLRGGKVQDVLETALSEYLERNRF